MKLKQSHDHSAVFGQSTKLFAGVHKYRSNGSLHSSQRVEILNPDGSQFKVNVIRAFERVAVPVNI